MSFSLGASKPLIESCTGTEWITGEDLTETERGLKAVFAVVDLVTLGGAVAATKGAELGAKGALSAAGKTMLSELTANTAAYAAGGIGQELDLPMPLTLLLSAAAGLRAGKASERLLLNRIKVQKLIPLDEYKTIRAESLHNVESDTMTLGRYEGGDSTSYIVRAGNTTYFYLGTMWDFYIGKYGVVDKYGKENAGEYMFKLFNKPALDDAVKQGKQSGFPTGQIYPSIWVQHWHTSGNI